MTAEEIKVQVPAERVGEFYRWFADWLERKTDAPAEESRMPASKSSGESTVELEAAKRWWGMLARREKMVWSAWVDAAPGRLAASEMVQELGFENARVIPGALSHSGRKGRKAKFLVSWYFAEDPNTGEPTYGLAGIGGLSVEEYADLLRRARAEVDEA